MWRFAAKEKTVELPMQQQPQMTSMTKHVVSKDMVPVFIVPLKPETRVPEKSITRYWWPTRNCHSIYVSRRLIIAV